MAKNPQHPKANDIIAPSPPAPAKPRISIKATLDLHEICSNTHISEFTFSVNDWFRRIYPDHALNLARSGWGYIERLTHFITSQTEKKEVCSIPRISKYLEQHLKEPQCVPNAREYPVPIWNVYCTVNKRQAMVWLLINRPDVHHHVMSKLHCDCFGEIIHRDGYSPREGERLQAREYEVQKVLKAHGMPCKVTGKIAAIILANDSRIVRSVLRYTQEKDRAASALDEIEDTLDKHGILSSGKKFHVPK